MPRVESSVKLGDEQRQGVERAWKTEYCERYSSEALQEPKTCRQRDQDRFKAPSPEEIMSEKLLQRGHWAAHLVRLAFKELDRNNDGVICPEEFAHFLRSYNIMLEPHELRQLISKYAGGGQEGVDYNDFLHMVSPEEFPRAGAVPEAVPQMSNDAWAHWNVFRLSERGRVKF